MSKKKISKKPPTTVSIHSAGIHVDVEIADPKAFDRLGKEIADGIVKSDLGKSFMAAISNKDPNAAATSTIAPTYRSSSDELAASIISALSQLDEVGLKSVSDALDATIRYRAGAQSSV